MRSTRGVKSYSVVTVAELGFLQKNQIGATCYVFKSKELYTWLGNAWAIV